MKIIKEIKENNQDFEFYPTTSKMAQIIFQYLPDNASVLDVGCGNGNIFNKFESFYQKDKNGYFKKKIGKKYGIEKSKILIEKCPKDIIILGTDFHNSTLIDKEVDIIFCNPPYSEFEDWAVRIIKEAYCQQIFLIIPRRWQESEKIAEALAFRGFEAKIIASDDFLDAERKARAVVDIIEINCNKLAKNWGKTEKDDPFISWFRETFKIKAQKEKIEKETAQKEKIENALVAGDDLVKTLCNLYRLELAKLYKNYQSLGELDAEIFEELNISIENLIEACKLKIKGLKKLYWQELFNKLKKINSRLILKYRQELIEKMNSQTAIDFDESNIYAVLIWVIKNSNDYFEKQIVDVFQSFCEPENIKNYKSNQKTWEKEGWRFRQQNPSHYTLELRVIKYLSHIDGYYLDKGQLCWSDKEEINNKLNDIFVIAESLGFKVINYETKIIENKEQRVDKIIDSVGNFEFLAKYQDKEIKFLDFKLFKNGNGHFKFNQEFIKKFNVEASRILGWIKSPKEAAQEFQGGAKVNEQEAQAFYSKTFKIENNNQLLLT